MKKAISQRLADKWSGVLFYRLMQDWSHNGFQLQPKDEYGDFITFHGNRLAVIIMVTSCGPITGELVNVSNEIFRESEAGKEILDHLISASRNDPTITAWLSRDYERIRSFWLGALVAKLAPDFEQALSSGVREAYVESKAIVAYLTEVYFSIYYDLIASKPECRGLLCLGNDTITDFIESRLFFSGDIRKPLSILWDNGVNLGRKYKWEEAIKAATTENGLQLSEDFQETVYQLINTTTDFVCKTDFLKILSIGAKGKLASVLNKATWQDQLDDIKRSKAQKRRPRDPVIPISTLDSIHDKSLSDEEALAIKGLFIDEESVFAESNARSMLDSMADFKLLTAREKQALTLRVTIVGGEVEKLTYKKLGEKMGISAVRAKQLFDSACEKLSPFYSSLDS